MTQPPLPDTQRILKALREARARLEAAEHRAYEPIAIIGLGCRFPEATDPEAFWELLQAGKDAITELPPERWDLERYYDSDPETPGKTYVRHGAYLRAIDAFDPGFFGIPPREAKSLDPQQRLLLEVSWEALERAGRIPAPGSATGVFVGIGQNDYAQLGLHGPDPKAISAYDGTGNGFCFASGRLSYWLGLRGPNLAVDTACSSSLMAVHLAIQSLRLHECDLALAGGVQLSLSPAVQLFLSRTRGLAPDGCCKAFDAAADGFGRGEGCGMVVLKRLSEALAEGDAVLAVIRGSACNHDGPSSGLTVPSERAQEALLRKALANARLEPDDIDYIEAHGTGTVLGDPIEVGALGSVFGAARSRPLWIGAVKANIGHLEAAAGISGLIKTVLVLQHGLAPPQPHFHTPNPRIPWEALPIRVANRVLPLPGTPARAGVSSFGMAGSNAHVVLEQAPAPAPRKRTAHRPCQLFTLSARSNAALCALGERYCEHLRARPELDLGDICHTAGRGRKHFEERLAVIASSSQDLASALSEGRVIRGRAGTPRLAFLFTSESAWYSSMGQELYDSEPCFRETLDQCAGVLKRWLPRPLSEVMYPVNDEAPARDEAYGSAWFALQYALACVWRSWGVEPAILLGHGMGELAAACIAGVFSLEDGLRLAVERSRLTRVDDFRQTLAEVTLHPARLPLISSLSGRCADPALATPEYWCHRLAEPRVDDDGRVALGDAADLCLEIGPEPVGLSGQPDAKGIRLPSLRRGASDWRQMLESLGELYVRGIEPDWAGLHRDYDCRRVCLPTYAFQRRRHWLDTTAGDHRQSQERLPECCYEIHWRPISSPEIPPSEAAGRLGGKPSGTWVVFTDAAGHGEALAAAFEARGFRTLRIVPGAGLTRLGARRWSVAPGNPKDFVGLLQTIRAEFPPLSGLVHLWSLAQPAVPTVAELERLQTLACGGALHALQALLETGPAPIWLITRGAIRVREETPEPSQAPLWGLGKVLALEHPQCWGGLVDLDSKSKGLKNQWQRLLALLLAPGNEDQLALRGAWVYVPRLRSVPIPNPSVPILHPEAAYLITGGLGSIGLAVAGWLAQQGARRLVLVGRRGPGPAARAVLADLERQGTEVQVIEADVADEAALRPALAGQPVRGIVHAAGVLGYRPLAKLGLAALEAVLRPKVLGSWVLQRLGLDLDFFVCLSSIASVWGSRNQAHYAAANQFLDTLAQYRHSCGQPGLSIDWGPWAGAGMSIPGAHTALAGMGIETLDPTSALDLMGRLLGSGAAQRVVAQVDWTRFRALYEARGPRPLLSELSALPEAAAPPREATVAARLGALPAEDRREALLAYLRTEVAEVLGLAAPQAVEQNQGFFAMGMDSMMAVELRDRLQNRLGRALPATLAFDCPSLGRLATHLAREVLGWDTSGPGVRASAESPEGELGIGERLARLETLVRPA